MASIFFEQLALIGAMSALVLAALWPHVKPILGSLIDRMNAHISQKGSPKLETNDLNRLENHISKEHPRLRGHSLRKTTTSGSLGLNTITGTYSLPTSIYGSKGSPHIGFKAPHRLLQTQTTLMPITLFTASVFALILYVLMKVLNAKLNPNRYKYNSVDLKTGEIKRGTLTSQSGRFSSKPIDRRKLSKMTREERAKQLILHHGGKNISRAIRFLVDELERQKLQLMDESKKFVEERMCQQNFDGEKICLCSCHSAPYEDSEHEYLTNEETRQKAEASSPRPDSKMSRGHGKQC